MILIHTSVKLVTLHLRRGRSPRHNFNPHEREARDVSISVHLYGSSGF